jgi:6-phosphogluconolactonase (cycloisomerase 2 family)
MPDSDFKSLTVDFTDTASGKLRPAGLHFVSADQYTNPGLVAAHPTKPFIYTDAGLVGILGYTLNANGSMTLIPGSPFSAPSLRAEAMYVTPNGKFLYVANTYGFMWGWSIDQTTGVLTALSGIPWSNGIGGHAMIADSGSKHLYAMTAGDYQDAGIGVFSIDQATGALTNIQSITVPGTGRSSGIGIDPSNKFLYATGFDLGAIDGFKIDATTGLLTFIPGSPFAGSGGPGEGLVVDPLGKYVYAGNRGGIAMYTIDNSTGVLTEVTGSPFFTAFGESSDFHTDPTGNFVYTNQNHTMTALQVDRTNNRLTFLNSIHTRGTGGGTGRWFRFGMAQAATTNSLTSRFAYVLNNQDKTISRYSIDDITGVLTSLGAAVPTGGLNPQAMAMDWYFNFLYVVNQDSNTVSAFTINPTTGALTAVAGSPFATGPSPTGVAVETTGRVLFVGTSGDDSLSQYTINPATGALTLAGSTPTGQCTGARSLVADWRGDYLYQVCAGSSKVASYALQIATGLLSSTSPHSTVAYGGSSLALSPYSAAPPHDPNWHSFGFLVSQTDKQIKHFIVGNEGELVMVSSGPVGPNQGIALDPLGRFAYATNATGNNVQAVSIDPSEGTLTEITGSPYSTGVFPIAAALDTTGRFMYVVNRDSNTVSGYVLNRGSGELAPMPGQIFATGVKPVAILISGTMQ